MNEAKNELKVYRAKRDMTQEELANLVSVARQTIISIEKGYYQPSVTLALKIAKALKTDINNIFYLIENEK